MSDTPISSTGQFSPRGEMEKMSDTPRTDNALYGVWYKGDHGSAIPALCRQLERELNWQIQAATDYKRQLDFAYERIRELERMVQQQTACDICHNVVPDDQIRVSAAGVNRMCQSCACKEEQ